MLSKLFEPARIGNLELRNRLVMLAMGTFVGTGHRVNDRVKAFYAERARGGVAAINVGMLPVADTAPSFENQIGIDRDDLVPGLREVVAAIHEGGARAFAQLGLEHYWRKDREAPAELVGPSPARGRGGKDKRALTLAEIHQMIGEFGEAARRAREAGFDGIELHAATGFMISQFMSACANQREDEYGGSLENRMRLLTEVIGAAREMVGQEFPITCKISGDDFMDGGNTLDTVKDIARMLEGLGVQGLNIAAGWHESQVPVAVSQVPEGGFAYLAQGIKEAVGIPVITSYRITDPLVAADIVAQGKADFVGMARGFIADPELANKVREGRLEDVRPCISCCRCLDMALFDKPTVCSVNPKVLKETEYVVRPAARRKKVFVVGGGPGGAQAATIAAQRGHDVTLFERGHRLGEQLHVASVAPYKSQIGKFQQYLSRQAEKAGVKVRLHDEATAESIQQARPDAVILATGARPIIPDIPGVNGANVATALEVLTGAREVGPRVVIIGGGMIGCEVAEFLLEKGKQVTVLEMLGRLGADIGPSNRWIVLQRLRKAGARTEVNARGTAITDRGVTAEREGETLSFEGDSVVIAVGMRADQALAQQLEGKVPELRVVGDAASARRILEAIDEGFVAGSQV